MLPLYILNGHTKVQNKGLVSKSNLYIFQQSQGFSAKYYHLDLMVVYSQESAPQIKQLHPSTWLHFYEALSKNIYSSTGNFLFIFQCFPYTDIKITSYWKNCAHLNNSFNISASTVTRCMVHPVDHFINDYCLLYFTTHYIWSKRLNTYNFFLDFGPIHCNSEKIKIGFWLNMLSNEQN